KAARQAADKMEAARDALEQGKTPAQTAKDAADRMAAAKKQLDPADKTDARDLSADKRRKLAGQVAALLARHKAAVADATKLQEAVVKARGWGRDELTKYSDLEDAERELAVSS